MAQQGEPGPVTGLAAPEAEPSRTPGRALCRGVTMKREGGGVSGRQGLSRRLGRDPVRSVLRFWPSDESAPGLSQLLAPESGVWGARASGVLVPASWMSPSCICLFTPCVEYLSSTGFRPRMGTRYRMGRGGTQGFGSPDPAGGEGRLALRHLGEQESASDARGMAPRLHEQPVPRPGEEKEAASLPGPSPVAPAEELRLGSTPPHSAETLLHLP